MSKRNELGTFDGIDSSVAAFITAVAETVSELDDIAQQPHPISTFLERLEKNVAETEIDLTLPLPQRDFFRTLFYALREGVLSQKYP